MVMSNWWREWVRGGGGRHDSMAGRWVMEVLLIVALGHDIYRENTRSYVIVYYRGVVGRNWRGSCTMATRRADLLDLPPGE